MSSSEFRPGRPGERFGALCIDFFLSGCVAGLLAYFWVKQVQHAGTWDDNTVRHIPPLVYLVPFLFYEVIGVAIWGRTLGKKMSSLYVSSSSTAPGPPGFGPAIIRYLVKTAMPLTLIAGIVSGGTRGLLTFVSDIWPFVLLFTVLSDKAHRQGIHDRAARTYVLRRQVVGAPVPGVNTFETGV